MRPIKIRVRIEYLEIKLELGQKLNQIMKKSFIYTSWV